MIDFIQNILWQSSVNVTVVFGLCLLFGVLGGILANRLSWMPTITAFMLLGVLIGPYGLGLISPAVLKSATIFIDIALGLILYDLGTMLHPREMVKSRKLIVVAIFESIVTYAVVFTGSCLIGLGPVVAAMIAAIAVSSSPAVLVHVAAEMRAKGAVSDRAKSVVAINNLLAFLLFSIALPFAMAQAGTGQEFITQIMLPLYRLAGAVVVGMVMAWLATRVAAMLRSHDLHYRFAIVIGAVMLTMGICQMLNMSALFAPLVLGVCTRWFEKRHNKLSVVGLGEGGDLFFIVLFVIAGAKINFVELVAIGWIPVALVFLRSAGKMAGVFAAGYITRADRDESLATGMMLVPMAGMAIGLVTTTNSLSPELGGSIATIIFTMVAIFETAGPFLVAHALRLVGEAEKGERHNVFEDPQG